MIEKPENKVTRAYSLSPAVTAWVLKIAQQRVVESKGEKRLNESEVVNDLEAGKKNYSNASANTTKRANRVPA